MRLSVSMMKWLKIVHLLCASCWVGGALSLMLLHIARFMGVVQGSELYGIDRSAHYIDMGIVVTMGAMGCAFTGLVYSFFTGWGLFKHRWIMVKWGITLACILFGTFYLGPWEVTMMEISARLGDSAMADGDYASARWCNFIFGILQVCILVYVVWISVVKPWKRSSLQKQEATDTSGG